MAKGLATKRGDDGDSYIRGTTFAKDSPEIEVVGTIDSFLSSIDLCKLHVKTDSLLKTLNKMQTNFGSLVGVILGYIKDDNPIFTQKDIKYLEEEVKRVESIVPNKLVTFNNPISCNLNEVRVRCRELERRLVPLLKQNNFNKTYYIYINRLSDYIFCLACEENTKVSDSV